VADPSEIISYVGGGAGGLAAIGVITKYIWDSVKGRKDQLESKAEADRDDKMEQVLSKLNAMELDMRSLLEKHATQIGQVAEVKARIEGISTNHGGRLGTIEQTLVELRTRIVGLEAVRPHRGK
jgi:hypothetical protein